MSHKLQNSLKTFLLIPVISISLLFSDNSSLSFDGVDDYVDFGDLPSGLNNFSYMGWYKFPGLVGQIDANPIFNTPNGFVTFSGDGESLLASAFISRDGVSPFYEVGTNNYGSINEWNHFSFTVNGDDLSLYINGELVDSDEIQSAHNSIYDLSQMGTHGRTSPPNSSFYNGSIDDFSFWSSTLTQEQIQIYMNTELSGSEEGLIGYWNFNDGEGSTLTDLSGNGNDGTIYGATWSTDVPSTPTLFFSEYSEGSSNNKYLEIYNSTTDNLSLDDFVILGNYNGNDWSETFTFASGATIAAGEVYVLANENSDQSIITEADETFAYGDPWYITSFNGDDVRALALASDPLNNIIDIIGTLDWDGDGNPGEGAEDDPGSGFMVAGVQDATANHTLVRKNSVTVGNNGDWTGSAGTTLEDSEWVVLDQNDWSAIGWHINDPSVIQSFDDLPDNYWFF